jgi:UDP-GlcNAc:undecaprenyl-phosphate GlcNAc-1-phosphate transferase
MINDLHGLFGFHIIPLFMAYPLTVFVILLIVNAMNLIDGLDGLACGVSAISSLSLLIVVLLHGDLVSTVLCAIMLGACLGFLPFNSNPARIFMGDTGALFLGYSFAVLSVQGVFKLHAVLSFLVPLMIFALPLFDMIFAIVRRLCAGKSPFAADRGHIHHRLIDMGFTQKQSVAIAYVLTGILGLAAVLLTVSGAMKAMIMLGAILVVGAIGIRIIMGATPSSKFWHHVKHGPPAHPEAEPAHDTPADAAEAAPSKEQEKPNEKA